MATPNIFFIALFLLPLHLAFGDHTNVCTITSDMGRGYCGYNSYCVLDNNNRPTCKCPEGYSLVDPKDERGDCQPEISFGCGADDPTSKENPEKVYQIKQLPKVNWPFGDYDKFENYTEDQCARSCLNDCNCAVAIYNTAQQCWKKRLPLSNGRVESAATKALMKIRIRPLGCPNPV